MTRLTMTFLLAALASCLSVSHMAMASGINFPPLQFPEDGTFPIQKPTLDDGDE